MATKLISLKCPECHASLKVKSGRNQYYCSFCGTKIILSNDNDIEYTYRHIDETKIRQSDNERLIHLKELENEAKRDSFKRTMIVTWICCIFIMCIIGAGMLVFDNQGGFIVFEMAFLMVMFGLLFMMDKKD